MLTTLKTTGINNKVRSRVGYYGQRQFSLFTVGIYMKQNDDTVCKNYALVTPENDHSCNISFGPNNFILSTMQADYDINPLSANPTKWSNTLEQFVGNFMKLVLKGLKLSNFGLMAVLPNLQFAFFMLSKFDHSINIKWNNFEVNHGKGVVDEIDSTLKHAVYSYVLTDRVVIKSLMQFAKNANEILPKITVQYVENESRFTRFPVTFGSKMQNAVINIG